MSKILTVRKHKSGSGYYSGIVRCGKKLIGKKVLIRVLTDEEIKCLEEKDEWVYTRAKRYGCKGFF